MSCAEFERELAHLMGAEPGEELAERANGIRRLREHVDGCDACAASAGLLTILELPEGRRDPLDDPGQAYWDAFEKGVSARIRREAAPARPRRWWLGVAAAAALLLVLLAGRTAWFRPEPGPLAAPAVPAGELEARVALPEALVRLAEVAPSEADDLGIGWDSPWDLAVDDGLFPDTSDLDGDARQALLVWLNEQTS